jgi:hypothetical protein
MGEQQQEELTATSARPLDTVERLHPHAHTHTPPTPPASTAPFRDAPLSLPFRPRDSGVDPRWGQTCTAMVDDTTYEGIAFEDIYKMDAFAVLSWISRPHSTLMLPLFPFLPFLSPLPSTHSPATSSKVSSPLLMQVPDGRRAPSACCRFLLLSHTPLSGWLTRASIYDRTSRQR